MRNLYQEMELSSGKIGEGIWMDVTQYDDGSFARIKLSLMGDSNRKWKKAVEAAMRPYRRLIESNKLRNDVAEKVILETFAKSVVLDWENIRGRDDEVLVFCDENVIRLFNDLPSVYKQAFEFARSEENFRLHDLEEDSKN